MSMHYRQVTEAFDQAAPSYDERYQGNPIMAWMRSKSLAVLQDTFSPASRLLEIGCGTGDEALALSQLGYRIVATDISPAMVQVAQAKAEAPHREGVTWRVVPAGQLEDLTRDHEPGSFDGAYSSFGALNCEPDLDPVAQMLAHLLRPGAALVCSVMNRWCVWEILWGLLHLQPHAAFRRLGKDWIPAGLSVEQAHLSVPTRYYRPRQLGRILAPHFDLQAIRGLPVFLPPPYLDHLVGKHPALLARLKTLEHRLGDRFPFHSLGDHFVLIMVRTESQEL